MATSVGQSSHTWVISAAIRAMGSWTFLSHLTRNCGREGLCEDNKNKLILAEDWLWARSCSKCFPVSLFKPLNKILIFNKKLVRVEQYFQGHTARKQQSQDSSWLLATALVIQLNLNKCTLELLCIAIITSPCFFPGPFSLLNGLPWTHADYKRLFPCM